MSRLYEKQNLYLICYRIWFASTLRFFRVRVNLSQDLEPPFFNIYKTDCELLLEKNYIDAHPYSDFTNAIKNIKILNDNNNLDDSHLRIELPDLDHKQKRKDDSTNGFRGNGLKEKYNANTNAKVSLPILSPKYDSELHATLWCCIGFCFRILLIMFRKRMHRHLDWDVFIVSRFISDWKLLVLLDSCFRKNKGKFIFCFRTFLIIVGV